MKDTYEDEVEKRGIETGATSGDVIGINGTITCSGSKDIERLVRTSNLQLSGDSGGPDSFSVY